MGKSGLNIAAQRLLLGNFFADPKKQPSFSKRVGKSSTRFLQLSTANRTDALIRYIKKYAKPDMIPTIGFYTLQGIDHYCIQKTQIYIGTSDECDVVIKADGAEPIHLMILYSFDSLKFELHVLGRLGCSVNGEFHSMNTKHIELNVGDKIRVSDWETCFCE
jgi:hypothetical protein